MHRRLARSLLLPMLFFGLAPGTRAEDPPPPVVQEPLAVGGDVKPPKIKKQVTPRYPDGAKASGVQGVVIVEAIISTEGRVEDVRVLRGHGDLRKAAVDAINQWEFEPGTLEGKPVRVYFTLTVNFSLKTGPPVTGGGRWPAGSERERLRARQRALREVLGDAGTTRWSIDLAPLYFPSQQGGTLVLVPFTLTSGGAMPVNPEIVAALFPPTGAEATEIAPMPLLLQGGGDIGRGRSFSLLAEPGPQRLVVILRDVLSDQTYGSASVTLDVPDFTAGRLQASSVLLASSIDDSGSGETRPKTVIDGLNLGRLQLETRPGNRVASGSTPDVVFFLTGATADESGAIAVEADYTILADGQVLKRYPSQPVDGVVTAQPLPLAGFAAGEYRLIIDLRDRAAGASISQTVRFRIE